MSTLSNIIKYTIIPRQKGTSYIFLVVKEFHFIHSGIISTDYYFYRSCGKKSFSKYISLFLALKTEKRDLNHFRRPCIVFLWRRDTIRCQKRYFREQRLFCYASMESISGILWYRIFQSCSLRKEKEWCYKIL